MNASAQSLRIRASRPDDGERVVAVWRASVGAVHDFVTPEDRHAIDIQVQEFLPQSPLWLAVDADDRAVAFMGLSEANLDALFVDADYRGIGVGRMLVEHAAAIVFAHHPAMTSDVNEQNSQAVGFYERMGFVPTGRSELDDHGRAYPLIRLRMDRKG